MMDNILSAWVSSIIQRKKASWMLGKGERWTPGKNVEPVIQGKTHEVDCNIDLQSAD